MQPEQLQNMNLAQLVEVCLTDPAHIATNLSTLAQKYASRPLYKNTPDNCEHKRENEIRTGMQCRDCGRIRQAETDFERRLVSRLTARKSGYGKWQMR